MDEVCMRDCLHRHISAAMCWDCRWTGMWTKTLSCDQHATISASLTLAKTWNCLLVSFATKRWRSWLMCPVEKVL